MLRYFGKIPDKLDDLFWLSQIVQAFGLRFAVEHLRRDWPHSTAALVWQYNDSWPGQTWSMIDYYHRWKASQYHARHMYAPVLVSGDVNADQGKVDIYVINERLTGGKASLAWRLATTDGKVLRHNETAIQLPANGATLAESVVLSDEEKAAGLPSLLLWMTVTPEGGSSETNLSYFALPGQLTLPMPSIQAKVVGAGKQFSVTLESAQPALWTWVNLATDPKARYSDNFVHLEARDADHYYRGLRARVFRRGFSGPACSQERQRVHHAGHRAAGDSVEAGAQTLAAAGRRELAEIEIRNRTIR